MSDKKDKFHGIGFEQSPLDGEEAAKHRHMFYELNSNWCRIDEEIIGTMKDASIVVRAMRILSNLIKLGGPILVASLAAGAFASSQGWF